MSGIALLLAMVTTNATFSSQSYEEAYQAFQQEGRPMVILIGADWCPACRTMKSVRVPEAWRRGVFKRVAFAVVDVDQKRELAGRLMNGSSIPQLIMYYKTPGGVRRAQINGARSPEEIQQFVDRAFQHENATAQRPVLHR